MTAAQAPPPTDGSGEVVSQPTQVHSVQTRRSTNLLSMLSPEERRAFLQEQLKQNCMFRQIAAKHNGVPGPVTETIIPEATQTDYQWAASQTGISEADVQRREELARREAILDVREELMRQALEEPSKPVKPEPVVPAPDVPIDEAKLRAELAAREAALAAREAELRRRAATTPPDTAPQPAPTQPATPTLWQVFKTALPAAGWVGGPVAGAIAGIGVPWLMGWFEPTPQPEPVPVVQPQPAPTIGDPPPPPPQPEPVVGSDAQTLLLLQSKGLAAPRTPLGEQVLKAFEKDPALRERFMKEVEDTLLYKRD